MEPSLRLSARSCCDGCCSLGSRLITPHPHESPADLILPARLLWRGGGALQVPGNSGRSALPSCCWCFFQHFLSPSDTNCLPELLEGNAGESCG